MKSNSKTGLILNLILGVVIFSFALSSFSLCFNAGTPEQFYNTHIDNLNKKPLTSAISGKIHINNNWTAVKDAGICKGNGTYSNPYTIKDLVINESIIGLWTAILIENSNEYFRIENCSLFPSEWPPDYGITLNYVQNGLILKNKCSFNRYGIRLINSNNNTISENIVNNANIKGISLLRSDYNQIIGNLINKSEQDGIYLEDCKDTTILENKLYRCSLNIQGSLRNGNWTGMLHHLNCHNIDSTNLVNGNPLYYYKNEKSLGSDNFTNAGQILLVNCSESLVSGVNTSCGSTGISLYFCDYNNISYNTASNNSKSGIYLKKSDNNEILGNDGDYNYDYGIFLTYSNNNNIFGNTAVKNVKRGSGIFLESCSHNKISENIANYNGEGIQIKYGSSNQIYGNTALYNYAGIFLFHSTDNLISGNIANENSNGIALLVNANNNRVTGNTANNNSNCGIYLYLDSNNNIITGNILVGNDVCIQEYLCNGNTFWDNGACAYGLDFYFELIIWISIISGAVIVMVILILIRRKRTHHTVLIQ